jgi:hypothetical protein
MERGLLMNKRVRLDSEFRLMVDNYWVFEFHWDELNDT